MLDEVKEAPQRQQSCASAGDTFYPVEEQDLATTSEAARLDVEANVAPAVGQHGMFTAAAVGNHRKPRREYLQRDVIGIAAFDRHHCHVEGARIKVGVPDDPGFRRGEARMLGESAAPIG